MASSPSPEASSPSPAIAGRFGRVAIVHEWLTVPGGSEQVLLRLLELFPQAELFTSVYDPEPWPAAITERPVHPSYLNRLPGARKVYRWLLPLMNLAFEAFDLSEFDLVVSSSHAFAKNVMTRPDTLHVCYCHTPMRYAWEPELTRSEPIPSVARLALPLVLARLRRQDLLGSVRPDRFVANSSHVAARIAKYYRRQATVIHPPVEVERLLDHPRAPDDHYLVFGRVVPYKRVDVAVQACARLGRKLKVAGEGRGLPAVRAHADHQTELLGRVPDADVPALLGGARALLFPGMEDFGIVPVEAQAAGVPVIAYGRGGVRDVVIDGETGVLYDEPTVDGLCEAILRFESLSLDEGRIRENAHRFGPQRFLDEFAAFVEAWPAAEMPGDGGEVRALARRARRR
jgi:glycosyltransferase involved in cell wall biosynthesis